MKSDGYVPRDLLVVEVRILQDFDVDLEDPTPEKTHEEQHVGIPTELQQIAVEVHWPPAKTHFMPFDGRNIRRRAAHQRVANEDTPIAVVAKIDDVDRCLLRFDDKGVVTVEAHVR